MSLIPAGSFLAVPLTSSRGQERGRCREPVDGGQGLQGGRGRRLRAAERGRLSPMLTLGVSAAGVSLSSGSGVFC